mgnify:FL=1
MRNEAIDKFNDKVIKEALQQVDQDKMAKVLAAKIEKEMLASFDAMLENNFDFEDWLSEELHNTKTVAGKAFQKAMTGIAKRMAEAI